MQSARRYKSESGYIIVVLPLVVLLLIVAVCTARASFDAASSDSLKGATVLAAKAAANQYDENGRIDFSKACRAFEKNLCENLDLNSALAPKKHSAYAEKPEYRLLIYNGAGTGNQPPGIEYVFKDGALAETQIIDPGLPKTYFLSNGTRVSLVSPGVIAEVIIESKKLFGEKISCQGWAVARIAQVGQDKKVVLEDRL